MASISVRNASNLQQGHLTVKPEPTDFEITPSMAEYQQHRGDQNSRLRNVNEVNDLTNAYYGTTAQSSKYAKTTPLTDRITLKAGQELTSAVHNNAAPFQMISSPNSDFYGKGVSAQNGILQPPNATFPMRRHDMFMDREAHKNFDMSAGDLLSRTHEELVLLLIQLRRQNSNTARAIEQCCTDIHRAQNQLQTFADELTRAQSIQRLDYLKQHLLELERQYEKGKPLVNLVDNMVKLGSLYRNNDLDEHANYGEALASQRLEFNQRMQEERLLQEEQRRWDRLSPNQVELQSKVRELYELDQLLQEESGTLQDLQRDKEDLERALGGLRLRIQNTSGQPIAIETAKKQQHMLERELSRVHQLLAENSKKLELTVTGNARLEQELIVLRQKLQDSRNAGALQMNGCNAREQRDSYSHSTTAILESELKRVQNLVGDMQRQRQELSTAVRQLTENSNRLYQEIGSKEMAGNNGYAGMKKRTISASWIETDLDSMRSINRTSSDMNLSTPLYVDTALASHASVNISNDEAYMCNGILKKDIAARSNDSSDNLETSGIESDDLLDTNPFAGYIPQDKQEIKTVRIVKRESERRRDRSERNGLSSSIQNLDQLDENLPLATTTAHCAAYEDDKTANRRSKSLPRTFNDPIIKTRRSSKHHDKAGEHGSGVGPKTMSGERKYRSSVYDKNYNYANMQPQEQFGNLPTGIGTGQAHLNPLANAYFAKHVPYTGHSLQENAPIMLRQKPVYEHSLKKGMSGSNPGTVFQSEAARQIINEMSAGSASEDTEKVIEKITTEHKHRRAVPREKRRHNTAPNNVNIKAMENVQNDDMNRNNANWRARDDLDMEVALRPRTNAPDVVRSALGHSDKISETTIDNLLLAPNKIVIPERYIPEKLPELSPEEKKRRQEKVESIKKMLADAPISTANETDNLLPQNKMNEEKKQREHLLQLNQILAQQVMQMSKLVAEKAMARENMQSPTEEDEM